MEYYERIQEIDSQIKVYDHFITDIHREGGLISNSTTWKHLRPQIERIKRLKQVYKAEDVQMNFFEAWHRRNLLEIYTNPRLIEYDKVSHLFKELKAEFKKRFNTILRNSADPKELYEILSTPKQSNNFTIDSALIDFFNFERQQLSSGAVQVKEFIEKGFENAKIYPDSMIFSVNALYNELLFSIDNDMIRRQWPRESGRTFLKGV